MRKIRRNTGHKQAYFPIFFSEYGPRFVRKNTVKSPISRITEENGYWRLYSWGMVSLYNHDYKKTSGFDLGINGWGLEDLKFAETLLNFKVIKGQTLTII